jgi:hypothetical protein
MADIRDRNKRAEGLSAYLTLLAVFVQWPLPSWFVSRWFHVAERYGNLITLVAVGAAGAAVSSFIARWIKRLPSDATVARIETGKTLTKERAASIICGVATVPIIWSFVGVGVADDLHTGTSFGSPFMYMNVAPASLAAALAVYAFVLRNLRRLPVTPDRPVVPRWPAGWPPPPAS